MGILPIALKTAINLQVLGKQIAIIRRGRAAVTSVIFSGRTPPQYCDSGINLH